MNHVMIDKRSNIVDGKLANRHNQTDYPDAVPYHLQPWHRMFGVIFHSGGAIICACKRLVVLIRQWSTTILSQEGYAPYRSADCSPLRQCQAKTLSAFSGGVKSRFRPRGTSYISE